MDRASCRSQSQEEFGVVEPVHEIGPELKRDEPCDGRHMAPKLHRNAQRGGGATRQEARLVVSSTSEYYEQLAAKQRGSDGDGNSSRLAEGVRARRVWQQRAALQAHARGPRMFSYRFLVGSDCLIKLPLEATTLLRDIVELPEVARKR